MKIKNQNEGQFLLTTKLVKFYFIGSFLLLISILLAVFALNTDHPNFAVVLVITILLAISGIIVILFGGEKSILFDKSIDSIIVDINQHVRKRQFKYVLKEANLIKQKVISSNSAQSNINTRNTRIIYNYYLIFNNGSDLFLGGFNKSSSSNLLSSVGVTKSTIPMYIQKLAEFLNVQIEEDSFGQKAAAVSSTIGVVGNLLNRKK